MDFLENLPQLDKKLDLMGLNNFLLKVDAYPSGNWQSLAVGIVLQLWSEVMHGKKTSAYDVFCLKILSSLMPFCFLRELCEGREVRYWLINYGTCLLIFKSRYPYDSPETLQKHFYEWCISKVTIRYGALVPLPVQCTVPDTVISLSYRTYSVFYTVHY